MEVYNLGQLQPSDGHLVGGSDDDESQAIVVRVCHKICMADLAACIRSQPILRRGLSPTEGSALA